MKSFFPLLLFILFFSFCIDITFAQVNADFAANQTSGCGTLQVTFTNASTGSGNLTYQWSFGDGATSTDKNPGNIYLQPGTYTVSLTVSNGTGSDTETKTNFITVFAIPIANFTQNDTSGCAPFTVTFTDQSTSTAAFSSWLWDFGDGNTLTQQNPQYTYNMPGNYTISLFATDANGCTGTKIKNTLISVTSTPDASFTTSVNSSCVTPTDVSFTNTTAGSELTYNWNFGDTASGAGDTSTAQNPPTHTYNSNGDFIITLIVSNTTGCIDTATQIFSIQPFSADFSTTSAQGCIPLSTQFSANNPTANSFIWTFTGGTPASATSPGPTVTYNAAGSYSATLIATNSQGCSDDTTMDNFITVFQLPSVAISANDSSSCSVPFTVNFSPLTSADTAWSWTFTGGTPAASTLQNPTVTYNASGSYNVSVTVTNSNGCSKTTTTNNFISVTFPSAQFNAAFPIPAKGCIPLAVGFTDVSTSSTSPITQWQWNFGDPGSGAANTSTLQNPTHDYGTSGPNDTGIFNVSLTITNAEGCSITLAKNAFVMTGMKPTADFTPLKDSGCHKFTVDFTNLSSAFTDEWKWNFTNGVATYNSNAFSPTQIFSDTGDFDISLVVIHHGCPSDTLFVTDAIRVWPAKPVFTASQLMFCEKNTPYEVAFTDASIGADSSFWDFGDGSGDTLQNQSPPPHTYVSPGFYTVTLIVKNDLTLCMDSLTQKIFISDINVSFESDTPAGCKPLLINFTNSSNSNSAITALQWIFGDGISTLAKPPTDPIASISNTTGIYAKPKHTYDNPGFYDVSLIVTDSLGCADTLSIDSLIDVKPLPGAAFTSDTTNGCAPLTVNFSDATSSVSSIKQWNWNFGDSQTDTLQNPTHTYTSRGQYTATLTIVDTFNCDSTLVKQNYINVTFPFTNFSVTGDTICNFTAPTLVNTSNGAGLTYLWNFSDGSATDTSTAPNHVFAVNSDTTVSFAILLTATDSNGCDSAISKPVTISIPKANFTTGVQNSPCPVFVATFIDSSFASSGIQSFFWNFGDGSIINKPTKDATHPYSIPGIFDVTMILTDSANCNDTITIDSLIKVAGPSGTFTISTETKKCYSTVQFSATTQNASSTTWFFKDGGTDSTSGNNVTHTYTKNSTYTPVLQLIDSAGCKVQISPFTFQISVADIDDFIASDTNNVYPQTNIVFTGSSNSTSPIALWEWDFGDGSSLQSTAGIPHKHAYEKPGEYSITLKVTDIESCTAITGYKITIIEGIQLANIITPNGDGKNDVFFIPNGGMKEHYIVIFNRWGEKIYENKAPEIQWYGKNFSGAEMPDGTYYYVLQTTRENGEIIINKNFITLNR